MTGRLARLVSIEAAACEASAREFPDPETSAPNRRREPRHSAGAMVHVRSSRGDIGEARLADVSLHGCSIHLADPLLRVGGFVSIGIGGRPQLQAIVRWMRDGMAGMEFLAPIPAERAEWHDLMNGMPL